METPFLVIIIMFHQIENFLLSVQRWCANRQMRFEGGFQGRTNKLVDGCYSFWQGGVFPIIYEMLHNEGTILHY